VHHPLEWLSQHGRIQHPIRAGIEHPCFAARPPS
jgi:hypothetical protein